MSLPHKPQDDAISLSSDSSPDRSPVTSPRVMPGNTTRMSVNNYGQPVRGPDFNRPLTLPADEPTRSQRDEIDLTQEDGDEDGDEDEELRRAIALSLQSHEEEQKRAKKSPKQDSIEAQETSNASSSKQADIVEESSRTVSPAEAPAADGALGFLGLDRKAMEAERLARLKRKREADSSTSTITKANSSSSSNQPASTDATPEGHIKRPRTADKPAACSNTRTKPITPPPVTRPSASTTTKPPASKPTLPNRPPNPIVPPSTSTSKSKSQTRYPNGAILKTSSTTHSLANPSSTQDTISLTALIGEPSTMTSALLSSFTVDFDWLLPQFSTRHTNFVLVLHTHSDAHRAELTSSFAGVDNVKLVFPAATGGMKGHGTMHGKLMLLFYRGPTAVEAAVAAAGGGAGQGPDGRFRHGRCRVVVPTGNLVGPDWGAGGVMENLLFVVDLPVSLEKMSAATAAAGDGDNVKRQQPSMTGFERGLRAYLTAQGVPQAVLRKLAGLDFAAVKDVAFVSSVAGFHFEGRGGGGVGEQAGAKEGRFDGAGLWGLSAAVRELGLAAGRETRVVVDYATSSLGSLGGEYLGQLYEAARAGGGSGLGAGVDDDDVDAAAAGDGARKGKKVVRMPTVHTSSSSSSSSATGAKELWRENLRVYFPSAATVEASMGGPAAAGTICFHDKWWDRRDFPREVLRDAVGVRTGMLGHYKLMLVRHEVKGAGDDAGGDQRVGWGYVGSANCSESAWGRVVTDRSTKATKLTVRNWECGVAFPVTAMARVGNNAASDDNAAAAASSGHALAALGRDLPVPMHMPGESLVALGKRPWFFGGFGGE